MWNQTLCTKLDVLKFPILVKQSGLQYSIFHSHLTFQDLKFQFIKEHHGKSKTGVSGPVVLVVIGGIGSIIPNPEIGVSDMSWGNDETHGRTLK